MLRRQFLASSASAVAALSQSARASGLNVLMIAIDDLRPDLGCYGSKIAQTPHMDALADRGTIFTRAYCQQAVCSPSRTSLLTGRRPDTTQVYELQTHFRKTIPEVVALPECFKNAGFATSGFSKIYHGGLDDSRSWSIPSWFPGGPAWNTPENAARAQKLDASLAAKGWRIQNANRSRKDRGPAWASPSVADDELADGKTALSVMGALETLKNQRFFLAAGFLKPHLPFVAPRRYFDLYSNSKIEQTAYREAPSGTPDWVLHTNGELRTYDGVPEQGPIPEQMQLDLIRAYYASASYTDAQIGKVLGQLDKLGLREKTIVVLWGDHGWQLGDHGLWHKHTNFELATRSLLIASAPGQSRRGTQTAGLTEFIDIYPSLCDLAGIAKPAGLEGVSFAARLNNPKAPGKAAAYSQYPRQIPGQGPVMGYSMRTERYRYTEWRDRKETQRVHFVELYDYDKDPLEKVNHANEAGYAKVRKDLAEQMRSSGYPRA